MFIGMYNFLPKTQNYEEKLFLFHYQLFYAWETKTTASAIIPLIFNSKKNKFSKCAPDRFFKSFG